MSWCAANARRSSRLCRRAELAAVPASRSATAATIRRHGRAAREPLRRPAGAALAATNGSARHAPPPSPLRPRAAAAGRRGGGLARLPLPLLLLREDRFPRQLPPPRLAPLLEEIDGLVAQGVEYVYFIDEIFLPQRPLLEALVARPVEFGMQTRIDLWKPDMLDLLGRAGCVSIEAGVESLTVEGRAALDKKCRMSTDDLAERLIHARSSVPFVQANLIGLSGDDDGLVAAWRERLRAHGVWANDPVPLYPYPSSPDYRRLWGKPDDRAWERAHAHYLGQFRAFSDIQDGGRCRCASWKPHAVPPA